MLDGSLRIGSLFSGIGGFELGLEWAGLGHTVFQVECDAYCLAILAKHWPDVPRFPDVLDVGAHNLPACDILIGGFPCQDISKAGQGAGLDGERSGLFFEFARLIGELRPRLVIMENVAAILGRGLDTILGTLAALGYDAEWDCIEASSVGAPHARDRWFLVAYPNTDSDGFKPRRRIFEVRRGNELGGGNLPRDWLGELRASLAATRRWASQVADADRDGTPCEEQPGRLGWVGGGGATVPDTDRETGRSAARISKSGDGAGTPQRGKEKPGRRGGRETRERERERESLADSDSPRLAQREGQHDHDGVQQPPPERGRGDWRQGPDRPAAESRLGGAPYGVPAWLDGSWEDGIPRVTPSGADRAARLRCLGNAVVPQVAAYVAERIKNAWRD